MKRSISIEHTIFHVITLILFGGLVEGILQIICCSIKIILPKGHTVFYFVAALVFGLFIFGGLWTLYHDTLYNEQLWIIQTILPVFIILATLLMVSNLLLTVKDRTIISAFLEILVMLEFIFIIILLYATLYKHSGLKSGTSICLVHDGFTSLYFSIVTFTTLGYGDYVPGDDLCKMTAALEALTGYYLLALSITTLVKLANIANKPT